MKASKVSMAKHIYIIDDWCHLCGQRTESLLDIWYPKNAEHDTKQTEYIRICKDCIIIMKDKVIPEAQAIVTLERSGVLNQWIVQQCPYCGGQHIHGAGRIDENPDNFLGHRAAECGKSSKGYELVKETK